MESDFVRNAFGSGWHIDRNRFDRMLAEQAEAAGAQLFLDCRHIWTRIGGKWTAEEIEADFLVDAVGRHGASVSRSAGRIREDELMVIAIHVPGGSGNLKDQRTWIETAPAGWWYSTPLPDGSGLAMFFTGAEIYRASGVSIGEQLGEAPMARRRLLGGAGAKTSVLYVPTGRRRELFGEARLLVGDSASSYDPLSGRGIFKALRQGEAAARAIHKTLRGDAGALTRYAEQVGHEFDAYTRQRLEFYSGERRWTGHQFWVARSNSQGSGITSTPGSERDTKPRCF
jgi:flavin-dependent dehydrogenase